MVDRWRCLDDHGGRGVVDAVLSIWHQSDFIAIECHYGLEALLYLESSPTFRSLLRLLERLDNETFEVLLKCIPSPLVIRTPSIVS